MQRHAAIMVNAYSRVANRSLEESLVDLDLTGIIDLEGVSNLSESENDYVSAMLKDKEMVISWKKAVG